MKTTNKPKQKSPYVVRIHGGDDDALIANCARMGWTTYQYLTYAVQCMNVIVTEKNIPKDIISKFPQQVQILNLVNKEFAK
jgi:hypothetical protein